MIADSVREAALFPHLDGEAVSLSRQHLDLPGPFLARLHGAGLDNGALENEGVQVVSAGDLTWRRCGR